MSDITPELLRRTAHQLEEDAAAVRRAVDGLTDLAGPHAWEGAQPKRVAADVEDTVHAVRRAAERLEGEALVARARATELARVEALASLPQQ
jgi:hypothetical protein